MGVYFHWRKIAMMVMKNVTMLAVKRVTLVAAPRTLQNVAQFKG